MRSLALTPLFGAAPGAMEVQIAQAPTVPEALPFDIPYGAPINLDDARKANIASVNEAKECNRNMSELT